MHGLAARAEWARRPASWEVRHGLRFGAYGGPVAGPARTSVRSHTTVSAAAVIARAARSAPRAWTGRTRPNSPPHFRQARMAEPLVPHPDRGARGRCSSRDGGRENVRRGVLASPGSAPSDAGPARPDPAALGVVADAGSGPGYHGRRPGAHPGSLGLVGRLRTWPRPRRAGVHGQPPVDRASPSRRGHEQQRRQEPADRTLGVCGHGSTVSAGQDTAATPFPRPRPVPRLPVGDIRYLPQRKVVWAGQSLTEPVTCSVPDILRRRPARGVRDTGRPITVAARGQVGERRWNGRAG